VQRVAELSARPAPAHRLASAALGVLLIGLAVLLLSMLWVL
jgi:hypothetical protein